MSKTLQFTLLILTKKRLKFYYLLNTKHSPCSLYSTFFIAGLFCSESDSEVMCCRFNPEGNLLAVGQVNGVIKVSLKSNF